MGLFGPSRPDRITKREYDQVMQKLYGELDERERVEVEKLFRADLNEDGRFAGITNEEFTAGIAWLREHPEKHVLEADDIALLEEYFAEHLAD